MTDPLYVAVKGATDRAVIERILAHLDIQPDDVKVAGGVVNLKQWLPAYNSMAKSLACLVVIDLDRHPCPVDYQHELVPHPNDGLYLRIAVREIEAWIMADAERLADFLRVPVSRFPADPDAEDDPKKRLIDIARRIKQKKLREAMVPGPSAATAKVGPGYVTEITRFLRVHWRPAVARQYSDSLARCFRALEQWKGL
jgi:hypothetical protein